MKDSFLIYKSFYEPIRSLSDKQLGRLFRAIFCYQIEGSTDVDGDIQMAFAFFKNQMDIDGSKYQKVVARNRENGSKGGRPNKEENPNNPVGLKEPKKADNDNDNDNDNGNDIITPLPPNGGKAKKKRQNFIPPSLQEVEGYCTERGNSVSPERFIDFYTSKGWIVGKTKMKDWKAAIRLWEANNEKNKPDNSKNGIDEEFLKSIASGCARAEYNEAQRSR